MLHGMVWHGMPQKVKETNNLKKINKLHTVSDTEIEGKRNGETELVCGSGHVGSVRFWHVF